MTFFPGKFKLDFLQIYLLVYANFGGWNVSVKLLNMSCPEESVYTEYSPGAGILQHWGGGGGKLLKSLTSRNKTD